MDQSLEARSSSQSEPQRGADGATRPASTTPAAPGHFPSQDSGLSRSTTPSDNQSSNSGTVINHYHYHCCGHHGPPAQAVPAPSADLPPTAPIVAHDSGSRAPPGGFNVYQDSQRLDALEGQLDQVETELTQRLDHAIAGIEVANLGIENLITLRRRPRYCPRHCPPDCPAAVGNRRLNPAHRGRSVGFSQRQSPRRRFNSPPRRPNISPPRLSAPRTGHREHSPRPAPRRSPSPSPLPQHRGYHLSTVGFQGYIDLSPHRPGPSRDALDGNQRNGSPPWEPMLVLSPVNRRNRTSSPARSGPGRLTVRPQPQGCVTSPAFLEEQIRNATASSAPEVRDSESSLGSVPGLEEPPQAQSSEVQPPVPNSPPSHPHSPGNRQADPQQVEAGPAPASPFTEAYAELQALLVPHENIAIAPPRPLLSTLAVPAPGLSQNILTTRSQLRAFFLDEVRLVRENNPNGTLEQLWEEFVADVNSYKQHSSYKCCGACSEFISQSLFAFPQLFR